MPLNPPLKSAQLHIFSVFTELCKHHHYLIITYFHYAKRYLILTSSYSPFPHSPTSWQLLIFFLSQWICLLWTFHVKGIIQYVILCYWLLSLSTMFLRLIHVVCISTSCVFIAEKYCIDNHILLTH